MTDEYQSDANEPELNEEPETEIEDPIGDETDGEVEVSCRQAEQHRAGDYPDARHLQPQADHVVFTEELGSDQIGADHDHEEHKDHARLGEHLFELQATPPFGSASESSFASVASFVGIDPAMRPSHITNTRSLKARISGNSLLTNKTPIPLRARSRTIA